MKRIVLAAIIVTIWGCGAFTDDVPPRLQSFTAGETTVVLGDTIELEAVLTDTPGKDLSVTLASSDPAVSVPDTLTVSAGSFNGTATATAEQVGSATITATLAANHLDVSIEVLVVSPVVESVTPDNGLATATRDVVIAGQNFDPSATVAVGTTDVSASCTVSSATSIACTLPDNGGVGERLGVTVNNPDASDTLPDAFTYTAVGADSGADFFCGLQFPDTLAVDAGVESDFIYGQVYVMGSTDASDTAIDTIVGAVGWGADGSDPAVDNWTWVVSEPNAGYDFTMNNDEHYRKITVDTAGSYDYAYRFSLDDGVTFVYCDINGSDDGYQVANAGALTVN